ncbi:hypothetical protein AWM67_08495 [Riemerella anatipestifer]|uniref:hypothetical protein n=1 Tax=Riemerella anatipestifer TaxID=34085 RepID=UPI0007EC41AC|nr:hypothetical protein [Riemerella anatipestifer]MDY3524950.1 hypothetical protein [Riemerella anatipestifer]OBP46918.1 hypothetical protein AWM67_08495 [Riemerella anatipestifer]
MNEEKQLYLVLTREWFNEILSGRKKEEYRAFTDFYIRRLAVIDKDGDLIDTRKYETVKFQMGYSKTAPQMIVEVKEILIEHDEDAGDELTTDNCNFVIVLGDILSKTNC